MPERDTLGKLTVRDVLLRRYPKLGEYQDCPDVQALLDPVGSAVGDQIEKWYAVGFRAADTTRLRLEFHRHRVSDHQLAEELGCSLSALNRMWNGQTEFRGKELLQTRFPHVFKGFKPSPGNEKFVQGCCRAMQTLFDHAQTLFGKLEIPICAADPFPPMEGVNFCYLVYLVRDETWTRGKRSKDNALLSRAAQSIHSAVGDSDLSDNGRHQGAQPKSPKELDDLHRTWFPWFYIAVETIVRPGYPLNHGGTLSDNP